MTAIFWNGEIEMRRPSRAGVWPVKALDVLNAERRNRRVARAGCGGEEGEDDSDGSGSNASADGSARKAGIPYKQFIQRIATHALARRDEP